MVRFSLYAIAFYYVICHYVSGLVPIRSLDYTNSVVSDPDSIGSVDPDPNSESGFASRKAKLSKKRKI